MKNLMNQKTGGLFWTLLVLVVALWGCGGGGAQPDVATPIVSPATPTTAVVENVLTIGISADVSPFMFREAGVLSGFDYDLMTALEPELGLPVEYVEIPDWARAYEELANNQYDVVISAASIIPGPANAIQFTTPYFTTGQVIVTQAGSDIQTLPDLDQKTIAVQAGTTGERWAEDNLDAELQSFNSLAAALTAVRDGAAAAAVYDQIPADAYINAHPSAGLEIRFGPVTQESYGIAVRLDDTTTFNRLNTALQAYIRTTDYAALCQKWQIAAGCITATEPTLVLPTTTMASTPTNADSPTVTVATAVPASVTVVVSPATLTLDVAQSCEIISLAAEGQSYVVQPGDTLWRIAENHYGQGIYYRAIAAYNQDITDPAVVRLGKEILLPSRQQAEELMYSLTPGLPEIEFAPGGMVVTSGSSTIFPLTRRLAECFVTAARQRDIAYEISVASVGSGVGIQDFCESGSTDLANASRPMTAVERAQCEANRGPLVELQVGVDAIMIMVSRQNEWVADDESLTLAEVQQLLGTAVTWQDIRSDWPPVPIERFYPAETSGTGTVVAEQLFGVAGQTILDNAPNVLLRSEDDAQLASAVASSSGGVGFFGAAYGRAFSDSLKVLAIDGRLPQPETVDSPNPYPLLRPLFLYTSVDVLAANPAARNFVVYYLTYINNYIQDVGYYPVSLEALPAQVETLNQVLP